MWTVVYWSVCVQSGRIVLVDESWGSDPCGVLGDESLLNVGVWPQSFGKACNLLTDVNHLVKVIVLVNLQSSKSVDSRIIDYLWGVEIKSHMNILPGLFRGGGWYMCSIGLVVLFIYLFFFWNDSSLNIQYLNSGCVKSCHFFGYAQKG